MSTSKTKTTTPDDLSTRAMLVKLSIHRWGAKRNDDSVVKEVAKQKKSDAALGKYTKLLLKSDSLNAYRRTGRECRRIHRFLTAPWDEGVGLLPAEIYFKYTEAIGEKRDEAQKFVDEFVVEYTKQWDNGLSGYKKGLGELFNAEDYPEPDRVRSKFGIQVKTYPIMDPDDFRVKLSGRVTKDLKAQMQQDFTDSLAGAMREPITRLYECLTKVSEKLTTGDAVFRDSLIGNVQELVELLPALNVLNDPEIGKLIQQTDKKICSVTDVKALRQDAKYRQEVADSANAILKAMKGYVS